MTPQQLAHEFFLGIRTAMTCPDVSVAEYEGVISYKIEQALAAEREACARAVDPTDRDCTCDLGGKLGQGPVHDIGCPCDALEAKAAAVRARQP